MSMGQPMQVKPPGGEEMLKKVAENSDLLLHLLRGILKGEVSLYS